MFRRARTLLIFAALIQILFSVSMSDAIISPIVAQENEYSFVNKWGSEGVGLVTSHNH
jgi:hypothetical protein